MCSFTDFVTLFTTYNVALPLNPYYRAECKECKLGWCSLIGHCSSHYKPLYFTEKIQLLPGRPIVWNPQMSMIVLQHLCLVPDYGTRFEMGWGPFELHTHTNKKRYPKHVCTIALCGYHSMRPSAVSKDARHSQSRRNKHWRAKHLQRNLWNACASLQASSLAQRLCYRGNRGHRWDLASLLIRPRSSKEAQSKSFALIAHLYWSVHSLYKIVAIKWLQFH